MRGSEMQRNRARALVVGFMVVLGATAQAVTLDWVTVGNAPNAPDDTTYGAVAYEYRMSTCETTAGQYTEFLNAVAATDTYGLYNTGMAGTYGCGIVRSGSSGGYTYSVTPDWANRPVNYVSFSDVARFANWMHNGQGSGDTETGAYIAFARQPGALFFIPTEDEWYKAAYYDPNKPGGAGYWDYPTRSDTAPTAEAPPGGSNSANFNSAVGSPFWTNEVGAYLDAASAYGTFDQGGNLFEWNETVLYTDYHGVRGGSWDYPAYYLSASCRDEYAPLYGEHYGLGFRLAGLLGSESTTIPEPATLSLFGLAAAALLRRRRRRA